MSYKKLNEGIEELQKYFPKFELPRIKEIVALDPTYKGGNELGKYGKWILKLAYNNIKNDINQKKFKELLKQNPKGINPNNGQPFQKPVLLPAIKDEDLYKVKDSLKKYDMLKNELGSIDQYKTLPELDTAINQVKSAGVPENDIAHKRYNLFKKAEQVGLKKIYEDNKWIVGIPTTKKSSCVFGEDTSWCTTSAGQSYYESYTRKGDLFINLNKETGELFQFHFETTSFMDENDEEIEMSKYSDENPNMVKVYQDYLDKKYGINNVDEQLQDLLSNENKLKEFFENVIDISIEDDYVYGSYDVINIPTNYDTSSDYIYIFNSNSISLKEIKNVISGKDIVKYNSKKYSLKILEYDYENLSKADELNDLGVSFDDLLDIYNGKYNDDVLSSEQVEQIKNILHNGIDEYSSSPVEIFLSLIERDINDNYYDYVIEMLKENLPLDDENPIVNNLLYIKFPIEDIKTILKKRGKDIDYNDKYWYEAYYVWNANNEYYWLYDWREIHLETDKAFSIGYVSTDWSDIEFDNEYWEEEMNPIMDEIIKIVNSGKSDVDKQIDEVLNLAKF